MRFLSHNDEDGYKRHHTEKTRSRKFVKRMYELKDYLNAINFDKKPLLDVINGKRKCYSLCIMHYDCIAKANEMNGYHFLIRKFNFIFT